MRAPCIDEASTINGNTSLHVSSLLVWSYIKVETCNLLHKQSKIYGICSQAHVVREKLQYSIQYLVACLYGRQKKQNVVVIRLFPVDLFKNISMISNQLMILIWKVGRRTHVPATNVCTGRIPIHLLKRHDLLICSQSNHKANTQQLFL